MNRRSAWPKDSPAIHCPRWNAPTTTSGPARRLAGVVPVLQPWLYRDTTDVLAARAAGVGICLGADWSPSGSKNLLGELKVADLWNTTSSPASSRPRRSARWPRATPPTPSTRGAHRAAEGGTAWRRARHHRPRARRSLPQPDRIDRARRAARRHQRPAVLRHHGAHEGGGRAARRADPPRASATLDPAPLRRRPRGRHGLAGRARRHRRAPRPRSGATSSSRSSTATRTPRNVRCGS